MRIAFVLIFCVVAVHLVAQEQEKQTKEKTGNGKVENNNTEKEKEKPNGEKEKNKDNEKSVKEKEEEEIVKKGNFLLPSSQQPGPLISLGQNIIDKQQFQFFFLTTEFKGKHQYSINMIPGLLYSFTDLSTIFINVPTTPRSRFESSHSSGFEDAFVQFEYAFYSNQKPTYLDQATLIASVTIPTGSTKKNPPTGFGSNSYLIGLTLSRLEIDWYRFTSVGALITTTSHSTKFGNQYLYQFGIGKNIFDINDDWILLWMVEASGTYSEKDRIHGTIDPNSGGNVIYVTPSIWASSTHLIFQLGLGYAVSQHLYGDQPKNHSLVACNLGWTF